MAARVRGRRPVVGVSGSYGGLNVGDEAILACIVQQLRAELDDVEIVVFTRDRQHTERHHAVDRVVAAREAVRDEVEPEVERLDLLLLGGGGILYDREAQTYLHVMRMAQRVGVPTATFAIGAGPLERTADRRAVAEVVGRMDRITLRDAAAKRLLEEIGVDAEIVVTADPALLLEPEPFPEDLLAAEGVSPERCLVAMSVREAGAAAPDLEGATYHDLLASVADFAVDRFEADVVVVPMERADVREAHQMIARMAYPEHAFVLRGRYEPRELLGLMAHVDLALGMRLHFLVFAAVAGVPVFGLPYAAKVGSFLERLGIGMPKFLGGEEAGALLAMIDRVWDLRAEHARRVAERLPELQTSARRTVGVIADLLDARGDAAAASA